MKRQLDKREKKELNQKIKDAFGIEEFIDKKDKVEILDEKTVFVNESVKFFYFEGTLVPTLINILEKNFLAVAVIDMPAVKFIAGGADVMRP